MKTKTNQTRISRLTGPGVQVLEKLGVLEKVLGMDIKGIVDHNKALEIMINENKSDAD